MFVRLKPNKSGTFSVQVVEKRRGRNVVVRSFGASKDAGELSSLENEARGFISRYGGQQVLDFTERPAVIPPCCSGASRPSRRTGLTWFLTGYTKILASAPWEAGCSGTW